MDNTLKTIYDRREGDKAVFITPYGQEIFWPIEKLDERLENGQIKYLTLCDDENPKKALLSSQQKSTPPKPSNDTKLEQKDIAIKMLEELLNGKQES
jgi:hypothetical protein